MDKLKAVEDAIAEILDDDRVTHEEDGTYTVRRDDGGTLVVGRLSSSGWAVFFPSEQMVPNAPRGDRPHELVFWALR